MQTLMSYDVRCVDGCVGSVARLRARAPRVGEPCQEFDLAMDQFLRIL